MRTHPKDCSCGGATFSDKGDLVAFADGIHITDLRRMQRKPVINWWAVLGIVLIVVTATLFWVQVARTF